MPANNTEIEKKLWEAADELRANSKLRSSEYSVPVLGLVFLKWADFKFTQIQKELEKSEGESGKRRRSVGKFDYQARRVLYLPEEARFGHLMKLPEGGDIGKAINDAMEIIEKENEDLRGILPKTYHQFESSLLFSLLRIFNSIPMDVEGDVFGKVYEYFLGKFAMAEGAKGGEFFTPTSIVKLIVEILEPFHGRIYDPACGSGGMFVQSARFVAEHMKNPSEEISIYGQEKSSQTVRLCKMNLAVHGLSGDIREGNTYYEDIHESLGKFDFVMANPPFNVDRVDKERIKDDPRFTYGIPTVDNANYLWIEVFCSALNGRGRAGFVMANSACDARASELSIRRNLVESHFVDVMITIGPKLFYTVGLPCTLWFFDKAKTGTSREDKVLFIDARSIYHQVDRAHRELTEKQIEFLANTARLYRDEALAFKVLERHEAIADGLPSWDDAFPSGKYRDVPGYCRVASAAEVQERALSLNPGRYVDVAESGHDSLDFDNLQNVSEEFRSLNKEAKQLAERIAEDLKRILEQ